MEWVWLFLALAIAFLIGFVVALKMCGGVLAKAKDFYEDSMKLKSTSDTVHASTMEALEVAKGLLRKAQELDDLTMGRLRGS